MTQQSLLWQSEQHSPVYAELCNALYERELKLLVHEKNVSISFLQGRLKSLPHYIQRTANLMTQVKSPLVLDSQNASWSAKQLNNMPLSHQEPAQVSHWYFTHELTYGLVVPIALPTHIVLDCIDKIDEEKQRFRTNLHGWFTINNAEIESREQARLLIPNKRVMTAACSGHCWLDNRKSHPVMPSLRELLLSCTINWRNFTRPATISHN